MKNIRAKRGKIDQISIKFDQFDQFADGRTNNGMFYGTFYLG